jgi:ABC-2 type transport system permease protein
MLETIKKYQFLFEELVKRDFKKKYKRTALGMFWSVLSPLLMLLVMWLVFSSFFAQNINHYIVYLFAGNIVFSFFSDSTGTGMGSLLNNAGIFSKVNVPKYMFLMSQNVSSLINFGLTLVIFFIFVAADGILFTWKFFLLLYPIVCLIVFNVGIGLILSALNIFFRDIQYLWSIFTLLIMYMSAIFYTIDSYTPLVQNLFLGNPIYVYIRYFRKIVLDGDIPTVWFHLVAAGYALLAFGLGYLMYKKNNHKFLYYI